MQTKAIHNFAHAAGGELLRALIHALGGTSTETVTLVTPEQTPEAPASTSSKLVKVSVVFGRYDKRMNSSPWIATIAAWPQGDKPQYTFLNDAWKGSAESGGCIEAEFAAGTVIRVGQKNYRNKGASKLEWRLVCSDGSTRIIASAEVARNFWSMSLTTPNA